MRGFTKAVPVPERVLVPLMELVRCVKLTNNYGLHARASTRLAQVARAYESDVRLSREEGTEEVDAKSILGLLTLGAEKGQSLKLRVSGEDAERAMQAILALFEGKFDED